MIRLLCFWWIQTLQLPYFTRTPGRSVKSQSSNWCQSRFVGTWKSVAGTSYVEGELLVVIVDPSTFKAILGFDMLATCTVDLSHKRLITDGAHAGSELCNAMQHSDHVDHRSHNYL